MIIWPPEVEVNERKGSQISGDQWVCADGLEQLLRQDGQSYFLLEGSEDF